MVAQRKTRVSSLEEIRKLVAEKNPELRRRFHVDKIGVFGSYPRSDHNRRNDIDFLVTFNKPVGYFNLGGLKVFMEELTGLESHVIP